MPFAICKTLIFSFKIEISLLIFSISLWLWRSAHMMKAKRLKDAQTAISAQSVLRHIRNETKMKPIEKRSLSLTKRPHDLREIKAEMLHDHSVQGSRSHGRSIAPLGLIPSRLEDNCLCKKSVNET
jgi:hypothetical protein